MKTRNYGRPEKNPQWQTSTFYLGDVAYSIVLVESLQQTSTPCEGGVEDWTPREKQLAARNIVLGWYFAALQAPTSVRFSGIFNWYGWAWQAPVYVYEEPITLPKDRIAQSGAWGEQALAAVGQGYSWYSSFEDNCFLLNNVSRQLYGYDWGVTLFVVRNMCGDQEFEYPDPGGGHSFAFRWGPQAVLTYYNGESDPPDSARGLSAAMMHETLHLFGAADEYLDCDDCSYSWYADAVFGYLQWPDGNCACYGQQEPCIMNDGGSMHICDDTRMHIGWYDSDGDSVPDPLDHPLSGEYMRIGEGADSLGRGWATDILDADGHWVRRLAASFMSFDRGKVVWDGIDYDGNRMDEGPYSWQIASPWGAGGSSHYCDMYSDMFGPSGLQTAVQQTDDPADPPGMYELKLRFNESDTGGGYVQARVSAGVHFDPVYIIPTTYREATGANGPWITAPFQFVWGTPGHVTVQISDVGGGHLLQGMSSEFQPSPMDVESGEGGGVGSGRLTWTPNPTRGGGAVELTGKAGEQIRVVVCDVTGARLRSLVGTASAGGQLRLEWDGNDDEGRPVAASRYFGIGRGSMGSTSRGSIVVLR